jgi:dienelactone hydrolase
MVKIKYVGRKPFAFDNVAHSGKCWQGHGDIQEVTEVQAKTLTKFADQWVLADEADVAAVMGPVMMAIEDEDGDTVAVDVAALSKPLEQMTKAELKAYAKHYFNEDIDARKSTKHLIDLIEEFRHDKDVVVGNPRMMKVE